MMGRRLSWGSLGLTPGYFRTPASRTQVRNAGSPSKGFARIRPRLYPRRVRMRDEITTLAFPNGISLGDGFFEFRVVNLDVELDLGDTNRQGEHGR